MGNTTLLSKLQFIILIILIVCVSCQSSPAEKELKVLIKEMSKTIDDFEKLSHNSSIETEMKESKTWALILKVMELNDKWVYASYDALMELSAEKCQSYSDKWMALAERFADMVK